MRTQQRPCSSLPAWELPSSRPEWAVAQTEPFKLPTKRSTARKDRVETASAWSTATKHCSRPARSDVARNAETGLASGPRALKEVLYLVSIGARQLQFVATLQSQEVFPVHVST